ncbi:gliding motility-associated C-terminal domain-containing protein [Flavobacterium sp. 140616W15]|uniref:gliding motility-associated C-terminal domain-containing protein n=1 Tax=Flavobacterium sp. 140616W15 TaxID=2478552 RepID=UPI000F0CF6C1|nr:gliding motility-associated C-terminal domain-containing protein [Flavobacterium sp. 140616W15]AYN03532.1 gliding motility-associated C-terminal domain-containing protein [Flavobacterium sp. 140616W15]
MKLFYSFLNFRILKFVLVFFLFLPNLSFSQNCTVNANVDTDVCPGNNNNLPIGDFMLVGTANASVGTYLSPPKWTQIGGSAVQIVDPNALQTIVRGGVPGNTYRFRLSAKCADGYTVFDDVSVRILPITVANAGEDKTYCQGTYNLAGNTLKSGETGIWGIVGGNGAGINIINPGSNNSSITVSGNSTGSTTLRWTITNSSGDCATFDDVIISTLGGIQPVTAGSDINLSNCYSATQSANLNGSFGGNSPGQQQGTWTVVSGPNIPSFENANNNKTTVNGLSEGTYVLRWTVAGKCANGADEITITVPPPTADVTNLKNEDLYFCDGRTSIVLQGTVPLYVNETVQWSQIGGPSAVIGNPTASSTPISGMSSFGLYTFAYTLTNNTTSCVQTGIYKVNLEQGISLSGGVDQRLACNISTAIIPITTTGSGKMSWSIIDGPSNPAYPIYPTPSIDLSTNSLTVSNLEIAGTYVVRIVKVPNSGSQCVTVTDDIAIVISQPTLGSNAGTLQNLACNLTTTSLAGNIPSVGKGKWSQVSGPSTVVFADANDAETIVSSLVNGRYKFRWTISGGADCDITQSTVDVVVASDLPTTANAGNNQSTCYGTPVQLQGNPTISTETGIWTVSPDAEVNISNLNDPNAIATGLAQGTTYTFTWTIANGCGSSSDTVDIVTNNTQGSNANAGLDQCLEVGTISTSLSADNPSSGTGLWTKISGPAAVITNPSLYNTTVTGLNNGDYEFKWTVSNAGCKTTEDTVAITIAPAITVAQAGNDQNVCGTSVTVTGNTPAPGETGLWEFVSGGDGPVIINPSSPTTTITGFTSGSWVYKWTISRGACTASSDLVKFNVDEAPSPAVAGPDQTICNQTTITLAATAPAVGTGIWSLISGPNSPVFSDLKSATSNLSGLISGEYILQWKTSNGFSCPSNKAQVKIKVTEVADAGSDYSTCLQGSLPLVGNNGSIGTWNYVSGGSTPPVVTQTGSNSASVTTLSIGTYVFRYTIAAQGLCPESFDDVSVKISGDVTIPPNAGVDQSICSADLTVQQIQLAADAPQTGTIGKWTVLAGPSGGSFSDDTNPNAVYMNPGFGVYVFNWTVSAGTCSSSDQVRVEYWAEPSPAIPEANNAICGSTTELTATPPLSGTGKWAQVSGPTTAIFSSQISPNTTVSNLTQTGGVYVFSWTVSNGPICASKTNNVTITVTADLTTPIAGPDQTICIADTALLAANIITVGTGEWSIISGQTGSFSNTASPSSTFTPDVAGTYILRWTSRNLSCTFFDDMTLIVNSLPSASNAGTPFSVCQFEALNLNANVPTVGTGLWTQFSGPTQAVFKDATSPSTSVLGTESGIYVFEWTISNGTCASSSSTVAVTIDELPSLAVAGLDQTICNASTAVLNGNSPSTGTGSWSFVINAGNTAVIANPNDYNTTVSNISTGITRLKWTIISGSCTPYSDEVNINKPLDLTISDLVSESIICQGGTLVLNTTPSGSLTPYSYQWQVSANGISGWSDLPGQSNSSYTTGSSLPIGEYFYRVNVSNSCTQVTSNTAKLTIISDPVVTLQPVGNTICSGATHTMSVAAITTNPSAGTLSYQWQSSVNGTSWANVSGGIGANTASYTTRVLTSNLYYRVRIFQSASGCEIFSDSARVFVTTITAQPTAPAAICVGGTVSMSVTASLNGGSGSLTYQWQSDSGSGFVNETNATATTTNFISDALLASTQFRCIVTSSTTNCTLTSNMVTANVVVDPNITVQPTGAVICTGGTRLLSVTATGGTPGLNYQWFTSTDNNAFTLIVGATSATYTTPVLTQTTYYRVDVGASGNGCGLVTSNSVEVLVIPDPLINTQPVGNTICSGATHTMSVAATTTDLSAGTLSYQWQSSVNGTSWANVSGGTGSNTASYTTGALISNLYYRVRIFQSTSGCETFSNSARVFVTTITTQPVTPAAICVGGTVNMSVTASLNTGAGTLSYQWQSDSGSGFVNETNATATTANFISDALARSTQFRCVVTSSTTNCTLTSNVVTANVVVDPNITVQPTGAVICTGGTRLLSVTATGGTPGLNYQWFTSTDNNAFTLIVGATSATYTTPVLTQTTYYRVDVGASGNGCGLVTSNSVEVLVIPDPLINTQPVGNTICSGATHTMSVAATTTDLSVGTLSYQWQSSVNGTSWANVSGGTGSNTASYTTGALMSNLYYRVRIFQSTSGCETFSNSARVFVTTITTQPVTPAAICVGGTVNMSVTASLNTGAGTLSYQWQSDSGSGFVDETNATASTANFISDALAGSTQFRCVVTSSATSCTLTSNSVTATVVADPSITVQPTGATICPGTTHDLSVTASNGTPGLTYQWLSSTDNSTFTSIAGATSATYTTTALTQTTYYKVEVASSGNGCNTITSATATVTVLPAIVIATQPVDATICNGSTTALSVSATGGSGDYNYQWRSAAVLAGPYTDIAGANSSSYTTVGLSQNTYYQVAVSDATQSCGVATISSNASVFVTTITTQPVTPAAICVGGTVNISVTASLNTGAGTLSYQWQSDSGSGFVDETNATASTANFISDALAGSTQFRCIVTSSATSCTLTSNSVTATVVADPSITVQPTGATICPGTTHDLLVTASNGTPGLTYQWLSSTDNSTFTSIAGATLATYTTNALTQTTYYKVEVAASGNGCNTITSATATVTVLPAIVIATQPVDATICNGSTTALSVSATGGSGDYNYQWRSATVLAGPYTDIAGANSSSYTTVGLSQNTYYQVAVSDATQSCGVATISSNASVFVTTITTQPVTPAAICVGGTVNISVTASLNTGAGTLSYQWQSDSGSGFVDETNATASTANFISDALAGSTQFRCIVTSSATSCTLTSNSVTATVVADPSITVQPIGATICPGTTHDLLVTASNGTPGLTYQWLSSTDNSTFTSIAGATLATYTTNALTQTTYYKVEVAASGNGCNTITSATATVTVLPAIVIATQPVDATICNGSTTALSVSATGGSGDYNYQWRSAAVLAGPYTDIAGANSSSYTTVGLSQNTYYQVAVSDATQSCGVATISSNASIFVTTITTQPVTPAAICVGGRVNISVTASLNSGTGTLSYQWQSDSGSGFVDETNATASTANFISDALAGSTQFRCIVTSSATSCTLTSNSVTATVVADPSITVQPTGATICPGTTHDLSVTASNGTPGLTYQWLSSTDNSTFTSIAGATLATYTTTALTQTTYYKVEVASSGNGCNTITSATATVTVLPAIVITTQPVDATICNGSTTALSVSATGGSGDYSYQWRSAAVLAGPYTDIAGANSSSYATVGLSQNTYYQVAVSDATQSCGVATISSNASIFVTTITTQPVTPAAICVGGTVNISVTASLNSGTGTLSYQWQSDSGSGFVDETNATASTANFISDALAGSTQFRCIVTSSATNCTLISNAVTANVIPDPVITLQPIGSDICEGGTFEMTSSVTNGSGNYSYQWQRSMDGSSWANVTDGTGGLTKTYRTGILAESFFYRLQISNSGTDCNILNSNAVKVAVYESPSINVQPIDATICTTQTSTLSVNASGNIPSGVLLYQWQTAAALAGPFSDVVDGSGSETASYTTPVYTTSGDRYFRVLISQSQSGCQMISDQIILSVVDFPVVPVGQITKMISCDSEFGTITISNPSLGSGYEYSIDGLIFQTSNVFASLTPGNKQIYVRRTGLNNCVSESTSFLLNNRICAISETFASLPGNTGGSTGTQTILDSDLLNGIILNPADVIVTVDSKSSYLMFDNQTNKISIAPGTPAGFYTLTYTICEKTNVMNCSTATETIEVTVTDIIANDDISDIINGLDGADDILNVLNNDVLGNSEPTLSEVKISVITPAEIIESQEVPVLDPVTGLVSVPAGTSSGVYTIVYEICENLNVANCDRATVKVTVLEPSITLVKRGIFSDTNGDGYAQPGELIKYSFLITNTGGIDLSNVIVTDPKAIITGNPIVILKAGESNDTNYAGFYVLTLEDINSGLVENQALVSSQTSKGTIIDNLSDSDDPTLSGKNDPTITKLPQRPELKLLKKGIYEDANNDGVVNVGDRINYIFRVINTGNVTIKDITVSDPMVTVLGGPISSLDPLAFDSKTFTARYSLTQDDIDLGAVYNLAFVNGIAPNGKDVDNDSEDESPLSPNDILYILSCPKCTVTALKQKSAIALIKTAVFNDENKNGNAEAGETISYNFVVTNTGNVRLQNITIKDPLPGIVINGGPISLAPGESDSTSFRGVYVIKQSDINAGKVSNQAFVTGENPLRVIVTDASDDTDNLGDNPTILTLSGCTITIFNAMSANGDSKNERFYIQGIECYPDNTVEIYNRWGILVFDRENYNNEERAFRGISEGRTTVKQSDGLPDGTYYYILKYKDTDSNPYQQAGYLYLTK